MWIRYFRRLPVKTFNKIAFRGCKKIYYCLNKIIGIAENMEAYVVKIVEFWGNEKKGKVYSTCTKVESTRTKNFHNHFQGSVEKNFKITNHYRYCSLLSLIFFFSSIPRVGGKCFKTTFFHEKYKPFSKCYKKGNV